MTVRLISSSDPLSEHASQPRSTQKYPSSFKLTFIFFLSPPPRCQCSYLRDKVALQPRIVRELPAFGARHLLLRHVFREVRGVGRILEELTVAEAGAVHPGDGEVQEPLAAQVAQEQGGGQQLRVGFAVVRLRDARVKHVAD